jgi:hypothetical protein
MDLTIIIQVAIGILFVWVTLAVITSEIQEWLASALSWRAKMLEDAITHMLGDLAIKNKIYDHPLIQALHSNKGARKPSGIPPDKFALVLFEEVLNSEITAEDVQSAAAAVKTSFQTLKQNVEALKNTESHELKSFATSLDTLLIGIEDKAGDAAHAITEARLRVESWFNNSMERLSGAYRRRVQIVGLIVGILVSAILNADSAAIAGALWKDPILRAAVVTQASQTAEPGTSTQAPSAVDILQTADQLRITSLPIGWSKNNLPADAGGWAAKALGIALSGMAAAQGAPYWFDLMRKLLSRSQPAEPAKPAG